MTAVAEHPKKDAEANGDADAGHKDPGGETKKDAVEPTSATADAAGDEKNEGEAGTGSKEAHNGEEDE